MQDIPQTFQTKKYFFISAIAILLVGIVYTYWPRQSMQDLPGEIVDEVIEQDDVRQPRQVESPIGEPVSAVQGVWRWSKTVSQDGSEVVPQKDVFTIQFGADGHLSGTTDCNGFGALYTTTSEGAISIADTISTLMYCEESQESLFVSWLRDTTMFAFEGVQSLKLMTKDGSVVHFVSSYTDR